MKKKSALSNSKVVGGVCGGLTKYFDVDPTIFHVLYTITTVFAVFGRLILCLVLWMITPRK